MTGYLIWVVDASFKQLFGLRLFGTISSALLCPEREVQSDIVLKRLKCYEQAVPASARLWFLSLGKPDAVQICRVNRWIPLQLDEDFGC